MTGLSIDDQRRAAGLTGAMPPAEPDPEQESTEVEVDRTGFMDPEVMRGFPMFDGKHGLPGGGAIKDSRPGGEVGNAKRMTDEIRLEARDLNGKARDIVQRELRRRRRRDHDEDRIDG